MKRTKKLLSLLLAVLMIALTVPMALGAPVASGKCGASLNWSLSSSGQLTITGTGKMTDACVWADYSAQIKSVSLPVGLTEIGAGSFEHTDNLTSITIPAGVKKIGIQAFSYCKNLQTVNLPSSLQSIGNSAFQYCKSLEKIEIPAGIDEIGPYTFMGCAAMRAVLLPKSVTSVGFNAFKTCYALKHVFYSGNEREWKLIEFNEGNEVFFADDVTIHYGASAIGALPAPESENGNIFTRILAFFQSLFARLLSIFRR